METRKPLPFFPFFLTTLFLCALGWGGLLILIFYSEPTLGPRWLFFFLLELAVSGTLLPLVYFLNRRFPSTPPVNGPIMLRQATLFGIYVCLIGWLQLGRVLKPMLALLIAAGLAAIEFFIRMWEQSRWKPKEPENE